VTVDGAGSTWTNSSFFQVGANGTGVLNVLNGGAVSNKSGSVGTSVGSDGRVTVDGAGSTWTNLQSFKVGANGAGVLNVLNGGAVSNTAGYVGYAVGSNGTVTVDGAGSTWTNSSFLMVGSNGTGALNVLNGGAVSNTFGYVGRYVGSDGTVIVDGAGSTWTNSGSLLVGVNGTGTLNVLNGGAVSSAYGYVGLHAGSGGTVTVAGAGSTWANSDGLYIGGWSNSTGGAGQVTVDNGGLVSVGMQLEVWREGTLDTTSSGEVVVGGAAVGAAGSLTIGSDAAGEFSVVDGGGVSNSTGYIGYSSGSVGAATVDGAGSTWANSNSLYIGGSSSSAGGTGELTISNDGSVHATNTLKLWSGGTLNVSGGNISAALMINDGGTVNFTSGRLNCTGEFSLGTDEFLGSSVTLGPAMTLSVGDTLELMSGSTLNVSGGTVSAAAMVNSGGTANFTSGWVNCTGDFSVAPGEFLGSNPTLGSGTTLSVAGTLTIDSLSDLTLNGGRLSAGSLQAYGEFTFNSGTFVLTDGDLTIGAGGQLGSTVELSSGQAVEVTNTTTVNAEGMITLDRGSLLSGELANDGLVRLESLASVLSGGVVTNRGEISGTGRISAMLVNEIAGEVRAGTGEQLRFSGLGNSNAGSIEAIGGEVEFTGDLTNAASTGLITGRNAMLRFAGGLTNAGSVALSFGTSDIFGDIDNEESGRIVISGAGNATFYDDLVNDGSVRISAGSSAVYFGEVSGSGSFIGTGTNYFEGDLCPGSSPGELDFGGDVVFGPFSSLQIELGGMLIGDEHDCLNVAGVLTLSGTLDVALIGDFTPAGGDTFDILNWGALAGATFDEVNLPELSDGLDWDTSELYTIGELSVTPEPATAAALLLGLGAVIRRRRKRLA
jgi:T5SS/PEP-CTERM-associated repeat protein